MVVIGINILRPPTRRTEEGISNAGAQDNHVPSFEEIAMVDQVTLTSSYNGS